MREYKFRAWNVFEKEMDYEVTIDPNGKVAAFSPLDGQYVRGFSDSEMILMQYTGLNDVTSKDIFDRDLVEIKGHPFHGLNMQVDGIYEVGYNDRMELCCGSWLLHRMLPYITVVGNIYENPELLEVRHG